MSISNFVTRRLAVSDSEANPKVVRHACPAGFHANPSPTVQSSPVQPSPAQ
ncbi:hypothetical protein CGRA01v4_09086 [Colletotrichum graminicola]|nr:hypothetical protein CGRA01v4_09086 [Colletotrichum graminicola]